MKNSKNIGILFAAMAFFTSITALVVVSYDGAAREANYKATALDGSGTTIFNESDVPTESARTRGLEKRCDLPP